MIAIFLLALLPWRGWARVEAVPEFRAMTSCFASPKACFEAFGLLAYGYNPQGSETIWQFLNSRTHGCEDILAPLAQRTPGDSFFFTVDDGARVMTCMKQIQSVAQPTSKEVANEFARRSGQLKQKRRKRNH